MKPLQLIFPPAIPFVLADRVTSIGVAVWIVSGTLLLMMSLFEPAPLVWVLIQCAPLVMIWPCAIWGAIHSDGSYEFSVGTVVMASLAAVPIAGALLMLLMGRLALSPLVWTIRMVGESAGRVASGRGSR